MSAASDLRERVRIEQRVLSDDGFGGQDISWVELATVYGEVIAQPLVRARAQGDQLLSATGYRIRIRTRDDVNVSMRFVWKGHTLPIYAMHELGELQEFLTYEEQV